MLTLTGYLNPSVAGIVCATDMLDGVAGCQVDQDGHCAVRGDVRIGLGGVWSVLVRNHAYTGRQTMHGYVRGRHGGGWSMVAVG